MTESNKEILDREYKLNSSQDTIQLIKSTIEELVNYGTHLLHRVNASIAKTEKRLKQLPDHHKRNEHDHLLPLSLLYFSIIETTDAIENGFSHSIAVPLRPLVRVLFESLVQMEWIYANDPIKRSYAYLTFDIQQQIKNCDIYLHGTKANNDFERFKLTDKWVNVLSVPQNTDAQTKLNSLTKTLDKPGYREANIEYSKQRYKYWYSMYDGPRNFRELSERVGRGMQYPILYKPLSASVHAANIARRVSPNKSINAMRSIAEMPILAFITIACVMDATNLFGDFFLMGEKQDRMKWYYEKIYKNLEEIGRTVITTSE